MKLDLKIKLFRTQRPDFNRIRKILIVRQDRLGDVILTLPMATAIHEQFPHIKVYFLVREYTATLCRNHPDVNETWVLPEADDEMALKELQLRIAQEKFDMAIVPNSKKHVARLIFKAHIPYRLSGGIRLHSWMYNLLKMQSRKKPVKHELDYNLDLLRDYMHVPPREAVNFKLSFSQDAKRKIESFLLALNVREYVIIHPGSGGSAVDLPKETMADLINRIEFGMPVIITGSSNEAPLYFYLQQHCDKPLINATGAFNLDELTALIAGCSLFLSNSTGPIHIANAFHKKLLGFYSTYKACHPIRWGPFGREKEATIIPPGENYDAMETSKEKSMEHMKRITAEEIILKINQLTSDLIRSGERL